MYGVVDPAGLRRPELGATGVERREEQPFGDMVVFRSNRKREGRSPGAKDQSELSIGVAPLLIYL